MRKALGKGLGALIPDADDPSKRKPQKPDRIGIEQISPSKYQPRLNFDEAQLEQLAESIRANGIIEPIIVRPTKDGAKTPYELVAGERRWRAAQKARLDMVPAIVREYSDTEALEVALIENLQREDLNPLEEARAYKMLIDEFGITQQDASQKLGVDRSTIANAMRLLKLDTPMQDDIVSGKISAGHARALLQLEGENRKILHRKIVEQDLNVRQAEELSRKLVESAEDKKADKKERHNVAAVAAAKDLGEKLSSGLGTKVKVKLKKRGGCIEIDFSDNRHLEGICHRLLE